MKYILFLIFFISGMHCWSQTNDSLAIHLKQLRAEREKLNMRALQLDQQSGKYRDFISGLDMQFNNELVALDSVAGKVIYLEKKMKLNSAEQQQLEKLRKQQEKMKNKLLEMDKQLTELRSQQDKVSEEIRQTGLRINQLDEKLKSLETLRQLS